MKSGNDFKLLFRILYFARPYRFLIFSTVTLTILLAALGPLRPWLVQYIIDNPIAEGNVKELIHFTFLLFFIQVVQAIVQYLQLYYTGLAGQLVIRDLRKSLFRKLISFRIGFFDKTPVGIFITRLVNDMETIADIFSEGLIIIIGDIIQIAAIIVFMFYIDVKLALLSLLTLPLLMIATDIFRRGIRSAFNQVRNAVAALNTFVQEHITGMSIVQIFGKEKEEMNKFREINRHHLKANIRGIWYYSIFFPVVEILSAVSIALVVWQGTGEALKGTTGFGTIVAFIMYINLLFRPIRELADKFNTLQMGMVSTERVFRIMDEKQEETNTGKLKPEKLRGEIEFRNVWFAYQDEEWVLRDVSFYVAPGESLAIVGTTGSGKTTIISLICGFYKVQKGEILIDGININEYDLYALRSRLGLVLQEVFLFSGSVYDNISMHQPQITESMVREAAQATGADGFIEKLPGGYQYQVHERGVLLSTGQRQLISFARAYAFRPDVIILDEATSSIDSVSEEQIIKATQNISSGRTAIIIAHRLSTIRNVQHVLVMEKGKVAEYGSAGDLLQKDGLFNSLYRSQFGVVAEGH
jgi:ATP-binding cassette subfamily B protein